jgi:hypothetical protein
VDLVRSCYTTTMRFFRDSNLEIPVTWYKCAPTAKAFPGYTRFASGNWASTKDAWQGPGEANFKPRPWSDGRPPGPPEFPVLDSIPLEQTGVVVNTYTTVGQIELVPDDFTVLVFAWTFTNSGGGHITSINDAAGNVYTPDLQVACATDARVKLEIWRAPITQTPNFSALTINFPGSQIFLSVGARVYKGLKALAPLQINSDSGISGTSPSVPIGKERHSSRLVIATFSCGALFSVATAPAGFGPWEESVTEGVKEDGSIVDQREYVPINTGLLSWDAVTDFAWVSGCLVYQGGGRCVQPGTHFCGSLDQWAKGSLTTDPGCGTDVFGRSICCQGPCPPTVNCSNLLDVFPGNIRLRVLQGYVSGFADNRWNGIALRIFVISQSAFTVNFFDWHIVNDIPAPQPGPWFQGIGFACTGSQWNAQNWVTGGFDLPAFDQAAPGPSMQWFRLPAGFGILPNQWLWDFVIENDPS